MCPHQYTSGLVDGFYLCAMMVLGISFIEHVVNHIFNRVTYTIEEPVEDVQVEKEPVQKVQEPVQEVQEVQEPIQEPIQVEKEQVQEVQELIQKVIQDVQELIQEVQDQPKDDSVTQDDSEVSTPRHKMRRLQM